jgi:hypothetical protein
MLSDISRWRNSQLVQKESGETSCLIIRGLLIDALVLTNLDPDALRVPVVGSSMPADFADGQALIDTSVINAEVPRDLAAPLCLSSFW